MIVSPDIQNQIDWSVNTNILAHLPEFPVDIVPITWMPSFEFKGEGFCKRDWILLDFMEPHSANEEYNKFWDWVIDNPPILTFRRELLKRNVTAAVKPIEFACYLPIPPVQTKEQFDLRPLDVLYFWGMSHHQRPKLHGDIFRVGMASKGIEVLSEWDHNPVLWKTRKNYWLSVYTPHYCRKPMLEIIPIMELSKITVAMPGNGRKTFRHAECVGTLMAMQADSMAWAYPWDETNSIQLIPEMDFYSLLEATHRNDLYELYLACDQNMRRYEAKTYANEYVANEIRKVL